MQVAAKPEFARALAAALVADVERSADVRSALASRRIDRDGLTRLVLARRDLFPAVHGFIREAARLGDVPLPPGLGQWEAIASAVSAAAGAATSVYGAKLTSEAQKRLAELELQKQQAAIKSAELQAKLAQAQYQAAETASRQPVVSSGTSGSGAAGGKGSIFGVPWWAVAAVGVAGTGLIGYILLRPRNRARR